MGLLIGEPATTANGVGPGECTAVLAGGTRRILDREQLSDGPVFEPLSGIALVASGLAR
jgi:hypothetical protein